MKILLINNSTTYLSEITQNLSGHDIEVVEYKPGIELNSYGQDLVILSGGGGEGREANDRSEDGELWYKDELQFILDNKAPMLGICMGFELIAQAYGSKVEKLPRRIVGHKEMMLRREGRSSVKRKIRQFKYHEWRVSGVSSKNFEVRGTSRSGIEVIRHKTKPVLATQFHPEIEGGHLSLSRLVSSPRALL